METFQEVAESQKTEDDKESSAAAGLIEKLSVGEEADKKEDKEKSDDKTEEKESGKESKTVEDKKAEEPVSSA